MGPFPVTAARVSFGDPSSAQATTFVDAAKTAKLKKICEIFAAFAAIENAFWLE
jgi:hypothetical protein